MNEWDKLNPREMWDFIDGVYLRHQLKIDELMDHLGMEYEKYLQMRKENVPLPAARIGKFLDKFGSYLKETEDNKEK